MLALICYKPAAAAVYATAFTMIGSGGSPQTVLMGFVMLLLSVLTLPALMRFFTWTTGTIASSGGGGQLLGAATVGAIAIGAMRVLRRRVGAGPGRLPRLPARPPPPGSPAAAAWRSAAGRPAIRPRRPRPLSGGRRQAPRRAHARVRRSAQPAAGAGIGLRARQRPPGPLTRPPGRGRAPPGRASGSDGQRRGRGSRRSGRPAGAAAAGAQTRGRGAASRRRDGHRRTSDDQRASPVRTYGGWRRSRGIGLLGLGPAATFVLLGCFAALVLVAAFSLRLLLYVAPPAAAGRRRRGDPGRRGAARPARGAAAALVARHPRGPHQLPRRGRAGSTPGSCSCPGTLAATELLSAEDGHGGRYGLVRDRHTGYLTATMRVAPGLDLAGRPGGRRPVGGELGRLAGLPRLPPRAALGHRHRGHRPRPRIHAHRPGRRRDRHRRAPARAGDHGPARRHRPGRRGRRGHPGQHHLRPGRLSGPAAHHRRGGDRNRAGAAWAWNQRWAPAGSRVLGRARAADIAGIVRTAFDPAVRGEISRLLATGISPALEQQLNWSSAGPAGAEERWDCYQHDSGTSVSWAWREPPRQNVTSDVPGPPPRARAPTPSGSACSTGRCPPPRPPAPWTARSGRRSSASEYARRTRRDVTARDAHDQARARQAADEEARGAGVSLLGLYVTVTVTDPAQLPRAAADTEAAAESSKIRLQRLYRSQAAGFTATLPCGICLPELARRFRH